MLKHLFKLIWNKKKQNFLLISEMLISFLVLFAVFTTVVHFYKNYLKPMGFRFEDVWVVNYSNSLQTENNDSLSRFYETVRQTLKSLPQVKEVSFSSGNVPFAGNVMQTEFNYNKRRINSVNMFTVETSYKDVLQIKMLEGRWYTKQDIVSAGNLIVINAALKEKLFGNGIAAGKILGEDKDKRKVIGVVEDMKEKGDYHPSGIAGYYLLDTSDFHWIGNLLIRVDPLADAGFESRLYKVLTNSMKNANVEIEHLEAKRKNTNSYAIIPTIIALIVAGFLTINVALGLLGVLWYNINKRRGEIGLRRAVGATGRAVSAQLVGEALILATLSLIIGVFFAVQFPLLTIFDLAPEVYILAIVLSVVSIYLLVLICSLYPGKQAAAIYPAVALHED